MEYLPLDLENIIVDFKEQMERKEHKDSLQSTLDEINQISYSVTDGVSWRTYYDNSVECYSKLNYYGGYDGINELLIHTYETTPPTNGDIGEQIETLVTITEAECIDIDIDIAHTELIDIDDLPEGYHYII